MYAWYSTHSLKARESQQHSSESLMKLHIALLSVGGLVSATDFYITSPYDGITWSAGQRAKVTWDIIPGGPDVKSVNVDLMDGDDYNAHVLMPIASGLSPRETSASWIVPDNFPSTKTVFIRVSGQDASIYRFSHRFAIQGEKSAQNDSKSTRQSANLVHITTAASTTSKEQAPTNAPLTVKASTTALSSESSSRTDSSYEPSWPTESDSMIRITYRRNGADVLQIGRILSAIVIAVAGFMVL